MKLGFGTWRFFLAFLVVISHLYADMIHGPAAYAVWGFFVLSGYLMTFVLTTKYGTDKEGLKGYAFNRFLRIYPAYVVALLAGVATIIALDGFQVDPAKINPQFKLPLSLSQWTENLTMFAFSSRTALPVPVAGALFTEVWAYALMPLLARSKAAATLAFIVAFFANHQFGFGMDSFVQRYTGFATGLVPFAAGALVCHHRSQLRRLSAPALSISAWCMHGIYGLHDEYWPWTYGIGLSVLLSSWVVLSLSAVKTGAMDKWLGDLSYPIYLLHTTVGAWFLIIYGYGRPLQFFFAALSVTIALSWAMVLLLDRRLQKAKAVPGRASAVNRTDEVKTGRTSLPAL